MHFLIILILITAINADYWKLRESIIAQEKSRMIGASIILNEREELVNKLLMTYKLKELDDGYKNPEDFAPSKHFFTARDKIENSAVFKIIKKMPKGGVLHAHSTALVSPSFLHKLTFNDNLYGCKKDGRFNLKFMQNVYQDLSCEWTLISSLRKFDHTFDSWLLTQFTMYRKNDSEIISNKNQIWDIFENIFATILGLVTYRPVFEEYLYESLRELYEDNVMYLEFRGTLPKMYELNGTIYKSVQTLQFYERVIRRFIDDHPKFIGARLIYGPPRTEDNTTFNDYVNILREVHINHPKLLAGFDLVGCEDLGKPLFAYVKEMRKIAQIGIPFYFHAGETNWYQSDADFNVIDAILLGTKRIGHAFALTKHPVAMEMVKTNDVAIELCPISNQVLLYMDDFRNHPASTLIGDGFPVVVSNDDPTIWDGKGLSYDFYLTFVGIAGRTADLRLLKQLALNSLMYSSLPHREKTDALSAWRKDWDMFIQEIIHSYF